MIWQGNMHAARHQSQSGDPNSSAQVNVGAGTKLLHCNESPSSNCPAKSPPGLVRIAVSTPLRLNFQATEESLHAERCRYDTRDLG